MKRTLIIAGAAIALLSVPALAALDIISVERAIAIAEKSTKGQVVEIDLDTRRNGQLVYEVDIAKSNALREIELDARSGKVIHQSSSRLETMKMRYWDKGAFAVLGKAKPLSEIVAEVELATGGKVIDVDFEHEDGQSRYEFEISTNAGIASFYVDPRTGKRLAFVIDD
ncbi:MAG: PepSY domain-containing protein [Sphingomonadales bacterium]|jgi:uncharacterized membrane protein YkoI|nr:PepSY domain-containing protein [Sphingomonadales bacterium]MBK9002940.1 PepSY domain-containing protein [Sphingomonadales bacterium]MBK9268188.1 PepSY domain-containing protein [Sphingomonadales bacterium]MBP6434794.1 PepSY domain-containing protein [Sphingorhabdus sp.]